MLVLTRKKDQTLVIGDNIEITVLEIQGDQIRFGISAPKNIKVYRKEIYLEIQQENQNAARHAFGNPRSLKELINLGIDKTAANEPTPPTVSIDDETLSTDILTADPISVE